jgi:hypothetical protein
MINRQVLVNSLLLLPFFLAVFVSASCQKKTDEDLAAGLMRSRLAVLNLAVILPVRSSYQ